MQISVVLPTHPARIRNGMTARAISSVLQQDLPATSLIVEVDSSHAGAGITRDRGLRKVTTPWVAFLDSDDEFKTSHLHDLAKCAESTKADYVYSWYDAVGFGSDPLSHFGKPFDPLNPVQTTVVTLVRTEIAQSVGFLEHNELPNAASADEDYKFTLGCIALGAHIVHLPKRTWIYNCHANNTSGLPTRGDAL